MYLIDTNVVSVSAPTKRDPQLGLADWFQRNSASLFLSAVTVAEIQEGIAKVRRLGASTKADRLTRWLDAVIDLYSVRVLPMDITVAKVLGTLLDQAKSTGQPSSWPDFAIAATAASRGLIVLTRNLRHFSGLAVAAQDPFETLPAG